MKNIIIYGVVFTIAFAVTSRVIYDYNQKYVNIFEFDFRDAAEVAIADSISSHVEEKIYDTDSIDVITNLKKLNKELNENYSDTKLELEEKLKELEIKENQISKLKNQIQSDEKETNEEWLKSTVKLYEAMDTKKASELLRSLPENEARDLIYNMKKKKAAEILSSLDTETVKRLTRAQQ